MNWTNQFSSTIRKFWNCAKLIVICENIVEYSPCYIICTKMRYEFLVVRVSKKTNARRLSLCLTNYRRSFWSKEKCRMQNDMFLLWKDEQLGYAGAYLDHNFCIIWSYQARQTPKRAIGVSSYPHLRGSKNNAILLFLHKWEPSGSCPHCLDGDTNIRIWESRAFNGAKGANFDIIACFSISTFPH